MRLCAWCKVNPVKSRGADTCSKSCGNKQAWSSLPPEERMRNVKPAFDAAYRKARARLVEGYREAIQALQDAPNDMQRAKLLHAIYVRGVNTGRMRQIRTRRKVAA